MIYRLKSLFVPAALLVGLAACGGGGGGPSSAGDAVHESWERSCAKIFSCQDSFPGTEADFTAAFGSSEADCVSMQEADNPGEVEAYDAAQDAGTIIYNADDAEVCLDSLDAITCDQLWSQTIPDSPPECDTALMGTLEAGATCTLSEECISGNCDGTCI